MSQLDKTLSEGARTSGAFRSHDEAALLQMVEDAAVHARKLGAERVNVSASENAGSTIQVRNGRTETAERKGNRSLHVGFYKNGRKGSAATNIFTVESIRKVVERACLIADQSEPDFDSAPADRDWLAVDTPDVPLYEPTGSEAALVDSALAMETAAVGAGNAHGDRVREIEAGAATSDQRWAIAIDDIFRRSGSASVQQRWLNAIAERDGLMSSGSWYSMDRRLSGLLDDRLIAETAIAKAVDQLGGRSISSRACPILFDAPVAASLVSELIQALSGMAQYRRATFLPDALGTVALADHVDLFEDPLEAFGLASRSYDGQGVGSYQRHVVRHGMVEGYFVDVRSARKLGISPTGHGDGARNLHLTSRLTEESDDRNAMLRRLQRGLWVTELRGGAVNSVTGAYSKAASGFWIEGGEVQHPVQDITIAGQMRDMLRGIAAIGTDIHRSGAVRTGSVLIETMQIAGR